MKQIISLLVVILSMASVLAYDNAIAEVMPVSGSNVSGIVTFTQQDDGVLIVATISGLEPGRHGFHIHTYGDCRDNATLAGGHFNPFNASHGGPDDENRHVGDLGNLVADYNGNAHYSRVDKRVDLTGPASVIGRSVVVHAGEDDLESQPSGAAGARIGCGAIGWKK